MYTFIKENEETRDTTTPECYLAITDDTIESLIYADTYGDFGQIVGADNAGDSIELTSDKTKSILKEVETDTDSEAILENDCLVQAYNNKNDLYETLLERLQEECSDEDYTLMQEEVQGFTFWNGSNHETVITSFDNLDYNPTHEEINENSLIDELNEAIENCEFVKEGFGRKIYETEKYWIEENYCEGHFESYAIYNKENVDLEEI